MLLNDNEKYRVFHGDVIPHLHTMPAASVPFSIYSPPFPSVYSYTDSPADLGNSEELQNEAKLHFSFFFSAMRRVMQPSRVMLLHCTQIMRMKRTGGEGMFDFRGLLIRLAARKGFIYDYDWLIPKNPQALRDGTKVLTPRGWVPIDHLCIGSEVIGSDGKATRVDGVQFHGIRPLYRVTFCDGGYVDCDEQHRWNVSTIHDLRNADSQVMTTGQMLAAGGAAMPSGRWRYSIPVVAAPVEFPASPLTIDPYLLGVLIGDGMLSRRSTVGVCCEAEIVESLKLPDGHSTRKLPGTDKGNTVASHHILGDGWHRNEVVSEIRRLGLAGKRAWEKHIPREYLFAGADSRLALLQGLMDTDGSLNSKGGVRYSTTSSQLAADIKFLVESLGGLCSINRKPGNYFVHKGEKRQGRDNWYVFPRLAGNIPPFRLTRKLAKWKPLGRRIHRRIVSIEPAGFAPCTCITVAASDGLFLTEHCIVTHNSQAIRTKSRSLQFAGLESDRVQSRGAMGDYLVKFLTPGENAIAVEGQNQVSRNEWIDWAEAYWDGIRENDTLNAKEARSEEDVRHICPLQLEIIRRAIKLYTNPGETVFSPFAGIGSEGYQALLLDRRFYGCELKAEYHAAALRNLARAESRLKEEQSGLFDALNLPVAAEVGAA